MMRNRRKIDCYVAILVVSAIIWNSSILNRTFLNEEVLSGVQYDGDDLPTTIITDAVISSDTPHVSSEAKTQEVRSNSTRQYVADGSPRIAYITYSFLSTLTRVENMIFASLDTWLNDGTYFVVLNQQWKQAYSDLCAANQQYCQRIRPLYVDCPEGGWGVSPCCKQQQGLLQMMDSDFFQHYDWFVFQDDDMYLRRSFLQDFLKPLDANSPTIATSCGSRRLGRRLETQEYNSSDDREYTYPWGQPVVYSRAALHRFSSGLRQGGLVRQCREFKVSHDAGNAILHWMYQFPAVRFRIPFVPEDILNEHTMGVHGVAKSEDTLSMAQVHDKLEALEHPPVEPHDWFRANGFQQTETYKKYGDPAMWKEWHTMPTRESGPPNRNESS